MQLSQYITDLLFRYDCVTIPEFGAFISQRISAHLDETEMVFHPPKKQILFNENITANDGILASYIAETEDVTFEQAMQIIANKVSFYKQQLSAGKTVEFDNIGYLTPKNNSITFEALELTNFLPDAYGLATIPVKPIAKITKTTSKTPVALEAENTSNGIRPYLRYAAVAVVALGISGYLFTQGYVNSVETHNKLAQEEAEKQLESKIEEATFVINKPLPSVVLNVEKQSGNYHIIAGAFRVKANASKKVEQLKANGYKARQIGKNNYGLHQVVYQSYNSRSEALTALLNIKANENSNAWMLIKKL